MQEPVAATIDSAVVFFDVCSKIEGLCALLYHHYSDIHHYNDDVSKMWKKTALEEEGHQKQFELALRLCHEVEFELNSNIDKVNHVYQKLNNLLEHVRKCPPDIITALTRSVEMEEYLADLHLDSSVSFQDKSISNMFMALREGDQQHVKSMQQCLAILTLPNTDMVG